MMFKMLLVMMVTLVEAAALTHEGWMLHALRLAERGRLSTAPNPWVGCVIVSEDGETVLAEGFHREKGGPHAEAAALAHASKQAVPREAMESATCYVTLEPCHRGPGKTTPPCDEALVAAGLRTVHVAMVDPDPTFGGAGVEYLRQNGITVVVGTAGEAVAHSLRPYLHQRRTKAPYVVLKVASAVDGTIACEDGTSQWITGPEARAHSQLLRARSQAILVGSGTALADNPRLTVRLDEAATALLPEGTLPPKPRGLLRVVLDARGRLEAGALLDTTDAPTLIFTTAASAGSAARSAWERADGVEVIEVPSAWPAAAEEGGSNDSSGGGNGVELAAVLSVLGARGIIQLMVEGGGGVLGSFLASRGLAQQMRLYVGATCLGSTASRWMQSPLARTIGEAPRWRLLGVEQLGEDACLDYALDAQRGS